MTASIRADMGVGFKHLITIRASIRADMGLGLRA